MGKWLREPLVHFLLLGGAIFLLYNAVSGEGSAENEIFISRGQQENLLNTFGRTWQRPPTPQEFQGLLKDYIRQEIAWRESRAMGLDQDDIVIRRRLRQKMEMLAEDVAALVPPTTEQLQDYLDVNSEQFAVEPRLSLSQAYFSADRREDAEQDATKVLQQIEAGELSPEPEEMGDPLPLPASLEDASESEVARLFGQQFTEGLATVETGRWSGPVQSGYGYHLVYVSERIEGRVPGLEEVQAEVQREWMSQRRQETVDGLYERLAENYTIDIESLVDPEAAAQGSP
jgi:hypothetical protein